MLKFYSDTKWAVFTWGGSSWTSGTPIPAPGLTPIEEVITANTNYVDLADGSQARVCAEKKYRLNALKMTFSRFTLTEAVRNAMDDYAAKQTPLKIVTNDGYFYEGYVEAQSSTRLLERGVTTQRYQRDWTYRLFDVNADGVIISGTGIAL